MNRKALLITALVVATTILAAGFWAIQNKIAVQRLIEASAELDRLEAPASHEAVDRFGSLKLNRILIGETFQTTSGWPALSTHYQRTFELAGWRQFALKDVQIWGKNYGGKEMHFSKPPYTATLYFAGTDNTGGPWNCAISIRR